MCGLQRIEVLHYFGDGGGDVVDVLMVADQQELWEPDGFVVRGALGHGADYLRIIHRLIASHAELRTDLGCRVKQIAAVDRLIEPAVAWDAFGIERGHE